MFTDGVPCGHAGCLNHLSHPCESCGRIGGSSSKTKKWFAEQIAAHFFGLGVFRKKASRKPGALYYKEDD